MCLNNNNDPNHLLLKYFLCSFDFLVFGKNVLVQKEYDPISKVKYLNKYIIGMSLFEMKLVKRSSHIYLIPIYRYDEEETIATEILIKNTKIK